MVFEIYIYFICMGSQYIYFLSILGEFPTEIHLWVDRYDAARDVPTDSAKRSEVCLHVVRFLYFLSCLNCLVGVVVTQFVSGEGAATQELLQRRSPSRYSINSSIHLFPCAICIMLLH